MTQILLDASLALSVLGLAIAAGAGLWFFTRGRHEGIWALAPFHTFVRWALLLVVAGVASAIAAAVVELLA